MTDARLQGPGKATMLGGGDGTMAADGSTLAARGGAATEHVSSGIAYDMCHGGQGAAKVNRTFDRIYY